MSTPPSPMPGPPPTRARNTVGVVSLSAGVALLVWNVLFVVLQAWTIASRNMPQLGVLGLLSAVIIFALALTAIICGGIGLFARDRPRAAAGIGTGIGIAGVVGLVNGLVLNALVPLFG